MQMVVHGKEVYKPAWDYQLAQSSLELCNVVQDLILLIGVTYELLISVNLLSFFFFRDVLFLLYTLCQTLVSISLRVF